VPVSEYTWRNTIGIVYQLWINASARCAPHVEVSHSNKEAQTLVIISVTGTKLRTTRALDVSITLRVITLWTILWCYCHDKVAYDECGTAPQTAADPRIKPICLNCEAACRSLLSISTTIYCYYCKKNFAVYNAF